jgi:adenylate kinase
MLRQATATGSAMGREAARYMTKGQLVPDPVILQLVRERLLRPDCARGYALDGFPRTLEQARGLGRLLGDLERPLRAVLSLEVRLESFVKRLSARRECSRCGTIYNLLTNPPEREGRCDACHEPLLRRPDDVEETIQRRFAIHAEQMVGIKRHYESQGILREIDGEGPVADIHDRIVRSLEGLN